MVTAQTAQSTNNCFCQENNQKRMKIHVNLFIE